MKIVRDRMEEKFLRTRGKLQAVRERKASVYKKREPDCSGSGDKVIYALTWALRRVVRPTLTSLFEPHYKQDLSANPKRTAKLLPV
jgi:hypothetical protein